MKFTKIFASLFLLLGSVTATAAPEVNKETYVDVRQGKIFCRVMGQEGTPLVVLHGGPGMSQDYLLPYMGRLAKTHQVIFYDQRGCGKSQVVANNDTIKLDYFIEDIEAIRRAFGFKKISLLGHSWGGHLAMHYAIRHPEAIDKLILSNPTPATSKDFSLFVKEWFRRLASQVEEIEKLKQSEAFVQGDTEAFAKYYSIQNRAYCYHSLDADKLNIRQSPYANVNGYKTYEILRNTYIIHPFDLTSGLKRLSCKTLIIHGDTDPIPVETAENIHKAISGSRLVVLDKCGHFPYVESPEPFFFHVVSFLKDEK